ncbi:MAG: acyl-CoA dehydratase activase [Desulfosarcinaceae bacterium]|nr:acyl-CoA dehydratase activase [Desulfosarcinaceae bacterium]
MTSNGRWFGLCLGATTLSLVQVGRSAAPGGHAPEVTVLGHRSVRHEGDPKAGLKRLLAPYGLEADDQVAVTGRKFRHLLNLSSISEPEAIELAYAHVRSRPSAAHTAIPACRAIVSLGGETLMVYVLDDQGRIQDIHTGNKCASGTGEFFLQQLRRMDVSLEQAARWAVDTPPFPVSGRCSVFCKSDCTHATNCGVSRARVTAGLCRMMAAKVLQLLQRVPDGPILLVGGSTRNQMFIHHLEAATGLLVVPPQAIVFEALGAALWAVRQAPQAFPKEDRLFRAESCSFATLAPLATHADRVRFSSRASSRIRDADRCLLGLDVGSTTTKAVLIRREGAEQLASVYLRTNGDPVGAARQCYAAILAQIEALLDPHRLTIEALGVCGSGRQIAGLHAMTTAVCNEITAHARAALFFDPEVDTIFEIGGQDAKYTFITNGVPADYAMNEACSAGTGSFLEESAWESLGIPLTEIADIALASTAPPNFSDQCAAFIASDIKNAIHEDIALADIVAGLVYAVCTNYTQRVKGNRPVGTKIFMQGGVCYNHAVPLAMAALTGKPIVVPPDPGLMGAFGAALEADARMARGDLAPETFDLAELAAREVGYRADFICKGGGSDCDRRCEIARVVIDGRTYPFGGACNRWYNQRRRLKVDTASLDLARRRETLIFDTFGAPTWAAAGSAARCALPPTETHAPAASRTQRSVGINRSFLTHTYYPLYSRFFTALGYQPVLPDAPSPAGIARRNAAFCYPCELAHGFFDTLLSVRPTPDLLFMPHLKAVPTVTRRPHSQVCPIVQAEPYILQTTFRQKLAVLEAQGTRLLTPLLDMTDGAAAAEDSLVAMAARLGVSPRRARAAFGQALKHQEACTAEMRRLGDAALAALARDPDQIAVVILSRPYNGCASEAHMGIPHKFASRGVRVIPMDFLPNSASTAADEGQEDHIYWGMGQRLLRAARVVRDHPQLFAVYVSNFSCGPDSFLMGYMRDRMGRKPTLTLELDSHTADAGLDTRIEAFLDIISGYRRTASRQRNRSITRPFRPARTTSGGGASRLAVSTSTGELLGINDPRVAVLFPSMGKIASEALAAAFRSTGANARSLPPAGEAALQLGRGNTTCKECLPLILTTGSLLDYLGNGRPKDEVIVYFMPTGDGPCRFGQYRVFMEELIEKRRLRDVALISLSSENGYDGLPTRFHRYLWWAVVVSDVMEDVRSMLLANAVDVTQAMRCFDDQWTKILKALAQGHWRTLVQALDSAAAALARLPAKRSISAVPTIALTGEIFVRRDGLSRQHLTERLAAQGFAVRCSPVSEWIHYTHYLHRRGVTERGGIPLRRLRIALKHRVMLFDEAGLRRRIARSGWLPAHEADTRAIIDAGAQHLSPQLSGEAILTVGGSLHEIITAVCGVIAIGPFGCMPNRISEAILSEVMTSAQKRALNGHGSPRIDQLAPEEPLPFMAIESDGAAFPQVTEARLEAFLLRARRLHERLLSIH